MPAPSTASSTRTWPGSSRSSASTSARAATRSTIKGAPLAAEQARRALDYLYGILQKGADIGQSDVDGAVRMAVAADDQLTLPTLERKGKMAAAQIATRKKTIYARSLNQDAYMRALERSELVFGIGPAGTGKTYLAVAHAAMLLERGMVERIILSRPAVEAGERLGFLPGDMKEKVDPYLRPLYDALYDMMPADKVERAIAAGVIEIAPLAFMRGRTLAHAAVILDEAQNTTPMQMKMFLTRLGENSRMIVTGDPTQIDLPPQHQVRPGRGAARPRRRRRRRSPCASTTPTSCAIRWWPRSSGPMTATPRWRAASAPARI